MNTQHCVVSTIIVSYNTAALTLQAVRAVLENYRDDQIDGEVIVVDNASTDDSVAQLKKKFADKITIIQNTKNGGFAYANNIGIQKSSGEYVFLLNSDTILQPHAIRSLLQTFTKYPVNYTSQQLAQADRSVDRLGIVTGKLLNVEGTLQAQGGALPSVLSIAAWWLWPLPGELPFFPRRGLYHIQSADFFHDAQQMGWVGGTAMMIKREVIEEIGTLDEKIFMYSEDVEYCWRARAHHWDILYTPTAEIVHLGSASSSSDRALVLEIKELIYVLSKHAPHLDIWIIRRVLWLGTLLRYLLFGILWNNAEKKSLYQKIFQALAA